MRTFQIGILTADRDQIQNPHGFTPPNYLFSTLTSLLKSGALKDERLSTPLRLFPTSPVDRHVFIDGRTDTVTPGATIAIEWKGVGEITASFPIRPMVCRENAVRMIRELTQSNSEWTVFMEDDVIVCHEFLRSIDRWLDLVDEPKRKVFSLYCPYAQAREIYVGGGYYWAQPASAYYGAQSMMFRTADLPELADYLETVMPTRPKLNWDMAVKDWTAAGEWPFICQAVPSFAQHIGQKSTRHPEKDFHFAFAWQGEHWSFDASEYERPRAIRHHGGSIGIAAPSDDGETPERW